MTAISPPLVALSNPLALPVLFLAVLGAFTAGLYVSGWMARLLVQALFGKRLPDVVVWLIRVSGGLACGWLAYLWLFGTGAGGWGFGTGTGDGKGNGAKDDNGARVANKEEDDDKKKEKEPKDKEGQDKDKKGGPKEGLGTGDTAYVEVLGEAALKKLSKGKPIDPYKCYRIEGQSELLTLGQVQKLILERLKKDPPLRTLQILTYTGSPDTQTQDLKQWTEQELARAKKNGLTVIVAQQPREAPVR